MNEYAPDPGDLALLASMPKCSIAPLAQSIQAHLQKAGFATPAEAAAYLAYLENLQAGIHAPQYLVNLSLAGLHQGAGVLLHWRNWLRMEFSHQTPLELDRIVLGAMACIQDLIIAKYAAQTRSDHLLPGPAQFAELLEDCQSNTRAERGIALLHVELPAHLPMPVEHFLPVAASRLGGILREHDHLFTIDRHTLGLLLANMAGAGHAMLAAHRVEACFDEALEADSISLRLHPRLGLALYPEHADTPDDLLAAAAVAAHHFAGEGVGIYEPERDRLGKTLQRLELPLREALLQNQFHMALQPQISRGGRTLHGMEALLRWNDETLGPVSPGEIVMVATHLGLMSALTQWVIHASLREFRPLVAQGVPGHISINLAPESLHDRDLPDLIANALAAWHVPGERVVFEITESALIENIDQAIESLQRLKDLGCKLALDDFGTGYSSLNYLKMLPIDELKIDASFVRGLKTSEKDASIVRSVIELAHQLKLTVISEGVEDAETARLLDEAGNDVIQGYFYSKPLLPAEIPDFVHALTERFPA